MMESPCACRARGGGSAIRCCGRAGLRKERAGMEDGGPCRSRRSCFRGDRGRVRRDSRFFPTSLPFAWLASLRASRLRGGRSPGPGFLLCPRRLFRTPPLCTPFPSAHLVFPFLFVTHIILIPF